jgi:hypothetical protein
MLCLAAEAICKLTLPEDAPVPEWLDRFGNFLEADTPAYFDAAMTLVPKGWRMAALCEREPWFCRLETADFNTVTWGKGADWITDIVSGLETTAKSTTPALALCAAALRAIAKERG